MSHDGSSVLLDRFGLLLLLVLSTVVGQALIDVGGSFLGASVTHASVAPRSWSRFGRPGSPRDGDAPPTSSLRWCWRRTSCLSCSSCFPGRGWRWSRRRDPGSSG